MKRTLLRANVVVLIFSLPGCCFGDNLPISESRKSSKIMEAQASRTYSDCVELLEAQNGGWCELSVTPEKPGISNIWPESDSRIRQVVGPSAVLGTWGTAAYDPQDRIMYFMGGGGTDYAGNEVYSFSLDSGKWTRLTDRSPLVYYTGGKRRYWIPDTRNYPAASHSYDGMLFNQGSQTIVLLTHKAAHWAAVRPQDESPEPARYLSDGGDPQQYEFNPSPTEARNGLSPLSWRKLADRSWYYPRIAQLADGTLIIGSKKQLFRAKLSADGDLVVGSSFARNADYGSGNLVYDRHRDLLWLVYGGGLLALDSNGTRVLELSAPLNTKMSLAFDVEGNAVFWDGVNKTYWMSPDKKPAVWNVIDWGDSGPTNGYPRGIFGKWIHIEDNIFVGISSAEHGVWVYEHPSDHALKRVISGVNIQKMVDDAPPGSALKLPPGLYSSGLKVSKSLTLDLQGVELTEVYGGKGILVIDGAKKPVVIKNFAVDGKRTYAQTGNLTAVRVSGADFDVTLDNLHVTDTALGVMTDNRGGKLTISNSHIGDIGSGKRKGLSHVIYAGAIDRLTVGNSTLERSMHLGHILKSRAKTTHISKSKLLGLDSRHSRVVDFPCGGELSILDSVLQSSSNSDNSDMISIGVEKPANCKRGLLPGKVEIGRSILVFDRGAAPNDSESRAKANRLFTWNTGVSSLSIYESTIVNPGGEGILQQEIGGIRVTSGTRSTGVFKSRSDANLNININTEP